MRIATVHLLIDVESDAQACDFLSETLSTMPYVVDWAHYSFDARSDTREAMVSFNVQMAQVHATTAIAQRLGQIYVKMMRGSHE